MITPEIGQRVRAALLARHDLNQTLLASRVDMTKDALSRALNGQRGFASIELADIARELGADLHYLITGEPDPYTARFAARHTYDAATSQYANDHQESDQDILDGITLAYRQAQPWLVEARTSLPDTADAVRRCLGEDFIRHFSDRVEAALGIDVIRFPDLRTDYTFTLNGRRVIALGVNANWFRANFSLAHELGHLALRHTATGVATALAERGANAFAAEMLMPEAVLREIDWRSLPEGDVAAFLWVRGVSAPALHTRLASLGLAVPDAILRGDSTGTLVSRNATSLPSLPGVDGSSPLTPGQRRALTATRRLPAALLDALEEGRASGRLNEGTTSWLLGVPVADETDHQTPEMSNEDLMAELGLTSAMPRE